MANVDPPLKDLQEFEAARLLLLLAYDSGTIDAEELLLLIFALDQEEDGGVQRRQDLEVPAVRFNLDGVTDERCLSMFRFSKDEIRRLAALLQLPEKFASANRTTWSAVEGLCIVLRRLAYPCRLIDLVPIFGRSKFDLSVIINTVCRFLYERWSNMLKNFQEAPWCTAERLERYAQVIGEKCPLPNCFGFIDGTVRAICRPIRFQRQFYNGHKRVHSLKFQTAVTPDGLIAHLYEPMEGRRHDGGLLRESGLLDQLEHLLQPEGGLYCVYGDPAYPLRPHLLTGYKGNDLTEDQHEFNRQMSACRVSVEWGYGKILQLFAFVDFKKNQKVLLQPVALDYFTAVLLTNCHTCLYGSETSKHFNCKPPNVEEYLA